MQSKTDAGPISFKLLEELKQALKVKCRLERWLMILFGSSIPPVFGRTNF